jgi:hypothetical protein
MNFSECFFFVLFYEVMQNPWQRKLYSPYCVIMRDGSYKCSDVFINFPGIWLNRYKATRPYYRLTGIYVYCILLMYGNGCRTGQRDANRV